MIKNRHYTKTVTPRYLHYTEANVIKGGEDAFKIRVPIYNCPFSMQPQKSWWIRGWKRAERIWEELVRNSKRIQETLEFEEVGE